ncbi:hypothetical protein [Rhodovulum sulfidophilum]|uniref:hypothetical protein n=1 Tax=Rhodovulum sulfidophilum TaxID=35806 RepID=UPI0009518B17|nr:hypothetical protein [Rhodovulum sulfidophilum]MBL3553502.1 hypothetical protein [Rhodovulum sulfidophilum]OLS49535.1 hypothetical protein BV379_15445 [Rhodovulum sulfidophilum]
MTLELRIITGRYKDGVALAEVEAAQRLINHYVDEGFVKELHCRDDGYLGFVYHASHFEERARQSDAD